MRRHLLVSSLLLAVLALVCAPQVRATMTDTFVYTETITYDDELGTATLVWQLPASPTPSPENVSLGTSFTLDDVPVVGYFNGSEVFSELDSFTFYSTSSEGGFEDASFDTVGLQLYTGSESAPTFTVGYYPNLYDYNFDAYGTLVIYATPTTPTTPEPSSLVLFGSGLIAIGGLLRRKLL